MISAKDARQKAEENKKKLLAIEMANIETRIKFAIENGSTGISYKEISKGSEEELIRSGYKVQRGSQYNEPYVTISW